MRTRYDTEPLFLPAGEIPYLHYHYCLEVGICYGGDGLFLCDGRAESVGAGDVILIFPTSHHYSRSIDVDVPCKCRFAYLDYKALLGTLTDGAVDENRPDVAAARGSRVCGIPPILRAKEYPEAVALLGRLMTSCFDELPHRDALCALQLGEFFLRAPDWFEHFRVERQTEDSALRREDDAISAVTAYMSLHYAEHVSAGELSALCHLSESQLRRRFHRHYHMSPMAYLNRLRCRIGAELLRHTDLTVAAVSEKVGYENPSDFYRHFIAYAKQSPSEFRKQNA